MPSFKSTLAPALISLLLSSSTLAAPAAPVATQAEQSIYNVGVEAVYTPTSGGAFAAITANPGFHMDAAANVISPPNVLSITVVNKHTVAISTAHAHAANAPTAIGGERGAGTMAKGATAVFAVPTGWIGNVGIAEASKHIVGDESLIEANFVVPSGYSVAVADVDVSYVNGFSVPIVCSCDGAGVVSGCNKNLWNLNSCPNNNNQGSCKNPLRSDAKATSASTFFKPCQGGAYTYVNDHNANSFNNCQSGHMTCCIGTACDRDPKQPN